MFAISLALVSAAALVAAGPAAPASAATSSYLTYQHGHPSKPVQWLDCKPIEYRINPTGMPKGMTSVVKRVFSIIHRQTGGTFHYAGRTTHKFGSAAHSATRPTIYISFTRKHRAAGYYFSQPGTIGRGGPVWSMRSGPTADGATWSLTTMTYGEVILYARAHLKRYGGGRSWQSLILHEVGHALDLAHRTSTRDVMYPMLRAHGPGTFSAKEVKRLRSVLKRTGCDYQHLRFLSPRPGGGAWGIPSPPSGVTAAAPTSTTATIRWSTPASTGGAPVIGYRVARGSSGSDGGPWETVVPATTRAFTFTRLTPNRGYLIDVQAITAIGYGDRMRALVRVPPA